MPDLDAFVQEYLATTWQNPFVNNERVFFHVAAFALQVWNVDEILIARIRSLEKGKGYGSMALDWLCALADKHSIRLSGTIEPCGKEPKLNVAQLQSWYRKHGFVVRGREISREPLQEIPGRILDRSAEDFDALPF
jgi:hypothetical protein